MAPFPSSQVHISLEVEAVRGMAMQGPISKYTMVRKTGPKGFQSRLIMAEALFQGAMMTMAATGSNTAVVMKPARARGVAEPACTAIQGEKIRFPAPKNMENKVMPRKSDCLFMGPS